jgi:hypothetical protein
MRGFRLRTVAQPGILAISYVAVAINGDLAGSFLIARARQSPFRLS